MDRFNTFLAYAVDWAFWWYPRPTYSDYWEAMYAELWKDSVIPNIPGC